MNLLVNQPFDFSVSLRVAWSMFWRMVLIAALLGVVLKLVMPPSALEIQMQQLARMDPPPSFEQLRAQLATIDYTGTAYAYHMFKTLLPIVLATFLAASVVFKKRYRRFALRVVSMRGETIPTRWMPALCIGTVFLLPTIVTGLISHAINLAVPSLALSASYLTVSVILGTLMQLYNAHLAVHWKYRRFRVLVEPSA